MNVSGILANGSKNFLFAIKAGLAGSAVYYISREGVWKDSKESLKVYGKLNEVLEPYVKEVTQHFQLELPKLPETDQISTLSRQYWNQGVTATFKFLSELDSHVKHFSSTGYHHIVDNPEIQKFIDSFKTAPPSVETTKK